MLRMCGRKFYLAEKDNKPVGVFSTPEQAQAITCDTLSEIEPCVLKDSPVYEGYLCMVRVHNAGSKKENASEQAFCADPPPVWGLNPQSAVFALCGPDGSRRSLHVTELYLVKIDHVYTGDTPENLCEQITVFSDLTCYNTDRHPISIYQIQQDYIGIYFEVLRCDALNKQKAALPEMRLLVDKLRDEAWQRANIHEKNDYYDTAFDEAGIHMQERLIGNFSLHELRSLSVLFHLTAPTEEVPFPDEDEEFSLTERVCQCIFHVTKFLINWKRHDPRTYVHRYRPRNHLD